jgi:hypothetical protein
MQSSPVSFRDWKEALALEKLSNSDRASYAREIITFLKYCKTTRSPATVLLAKQFVEEQECLRGGPVRVALRWFFKAAQVRMGKAKEPETRSGHEMVGPSSISRPDSIGLRPMEPKPARNDMGSSPWEEALIKTMRLRGLLWRTEYTYRRWAQRFAQYIAPKTPYGAGGVEVQAFLSDLAVRGRSSASAQRQALNALVFLIQEALGRELGDLDFKRAAPRERVPTVLTREECRRIFAQMNGTHRLMAELAYGSGLRLIELLRLRVHHLDMDR